MTGQFGKLTKTLSSLQISLPIVVIDVFLLVFLKEDRCDTYSGGY